MTNDRIEINPNVMLGKPVIRGTRIPVELILRKLSEGLSEGELLDAYPRLQREDIQAALAYAADSVATREFEFIHSHDTPPVRFLANVGVEGHVDSLLLSKREAILRIAAQHGAHNVRVFGSFSRNQAGPDSDIDLLVDMDMDRTLLDRIALWQDLEDLLGRKVDVVTPKALHWLIRDRVLSEAVPL